VVGRDSSVGIATGYGLDGPGIESRWGVEIFRTCPDRPWDPPSLLFNGYRFFPGGKERLGRDADPSPPSSAVGHERVELYLCSPCGPYSLYRASAPVQGCTLPFTLYVYVSNQTGIATFYHFICIVYVRRIAVWIYHVWF